MVKLRRIGKFYVSKVFIEECQSELHKILNYLEFIPIKTSYDYFKEGFLYIGYSIRFDEISNYDEIPEYSIMISRNCKGTLDIEVDKVKV